MRPYCCPNGTTIAMELPNIQQSVRTHTSSKFLALRESGKQHDRNSGERKTIIPRTPAFRLTIASELAHIMLPNSRRITNASFSPIDAAYLLMNLTILLHPPFHSADLSSHTTYISPNIPLLSPSLSIIQLQFLRLRLPTTIAAITILPIQTAHSYLNNRT